MWNLLVLGWSKMTLSGSGKVHLRSSEDVQKSFKFSASQPVAGKRLMEHDGFKLHGFVMNGTRLFGKFVKVLMLKSNLLRTRGR